MNRSITRTCTVAAGLVVSLGASNASAQLWNIFDTKPKPNMLIAFDTSVTMGINSSCTGCHSPPTRLDDAKVEIRNTLPLFKDLFIYGGYTYRGCGSAHVVRREIPNPADLDDSYNRLDGMIAGAGYCGSSERNLPGGSITTCITPTPMCAGDPAVLQSLAAPGALPGLTFPTSGAAPGIGMPPTTTQPAWSYSGATWTLNCNTTTLVPAGPYANINLQSQFAMHMASAAGGWPRWNVNIPPGQVQAELCVPMETALSNLATDIEQCVGTATAAFWWDLRGFVNLGQNAWCDQVAISNSACTGSPLVGTCVCDDTQPGCTSGAAISECGFPMLYKARQQVGVCESYDPDGAFGSYYRGPNQLDNRVNPGGCRENVVLFFTDGAFGDNAMIPRPFEAQQAWQTYASLATGDRNMFVFHISSEFTGAGRAMARALLDDPAASYYDARNQAQMISSFARIVNRVYRGVYAGSNMTFDRYGTRVALHGFHVPSGPPTAPAGGETYLGRPSFISWRSVDDAGNIGPPIFETDWQGRAGVLAPGAWGTLNSPSLPPAPNPPGSWANLLGPGGSFRNGVPRVVNITRGTVDRNGDNVVNGADLAATPQNLRWGFMSGGSSTQPVIVEGPREVPEGVNAANYATFLNNVQNRDRVVYVMSNGYLHAFYVGRKVAGATTFGKIGLAYTYPEDGNSGKEIFKYLPPWLNTVSGYQYNDIVQRPLTTGQIIAREMQIANNNNANDFATLLAVAQGKDGRGYSVLNVTDPYNPAVLKEITVRAPNRASVEPMLYQFPNGTPGQLKTVLVVTGGYNPDPTTPARPELHAYDVGAAYNWAPNANGNTFITLPGTAQYPTEPACLDLLGKGYTTHCYVLAVDGTLARVTVDATGAFTSAVDITPPGNVVRDGARRFYTRPVVFFGADGEVNIAFGSGDITNLTGATGANDAFFKLRDNITRSATPNATATEQNACTPAAGNRDGVFPLAAGERVVSPPIVSKGVVAFTTYTPVGGAVAACNAGQANLYAFNYQQCTDVFNSANPRPVAVPAGNGIPNSPSLIRGAQRLVTQTSAQPTAPQAAVSPALSRGNTLMSARRVFWRTEISAP